MPRVGLDFNTILSTAIDIADKDGVEAVTLATIARKLSVKPPSLFNHINGLPSLKREMSLAGLTMLYDKMKNAMVGEEKDDVLISMANAYVEFTREHPGLYELTIQAPEKEDQEMEIASSNIILLITEVLNDYNLDQEMTIHTIRGLRSILHGFAALEQKGAFGIQINIEESFHYLIKSFISVLNQK